MSKEWKADESVLETLLESSLLPLLESSFRNGSWLDMAKDSHVYHSYLGNLLNFFLFVYISINIIALTRAIAS